MRVLLTGTIDLGISLGIDDHAFSRTSLLNTVSSAFDARNAGSLDRIVHLVRFPPVDSVPMQEIDFPLGNGLEVDLDKTGHIKELQSEARSFGTGDKIRWLLDWVPALEPLSRDIDASEARLETLLGNVGIRASRLVVYGIGVGSLQILSDEIPEVDADLALAFCKCYEYAAYRGFSMSLQETLVEILQVFRSSDRLESITSRFDLSGRSEIDAFDNQARADVFDQGFHHSVICDDRESIGTVRDLIQAYETERNLEFVHNDCGEIYLGWAGSVVHVPAHSGQPDGDGIGLGLGFSRLIETASVSLAVAMIFEKHFTNLMRQAVRQALGEEKIPLEWARLNELRALAGAIPEMTTFASMTSSISALTFFNAWDRICAIQERHSRIRRVSEQFHTIQSEAIRVAEDRRQRVLSRWGLVLTAITLVSAAADVIATIDYNHDILPQLIGRIFFLAALPLLFIWLVRFSLVVREPAPSQRERSK